MADADSLAREFEAHRTHLRGVAYRILGSGSDADDAVQETWLRLRRSDVSDVVNLRAWLTTVVSRVALNMIESRGSRREDLGAEPPEPADDRPRARGTAPSPEDEALLGMALAADSLDSQYGHGFPATPQPRQPGNASIARGKRDSQGRDLAWKVPGRNALAVQPGT